MLESDKFMRRSKSFYPNSYKFTFNSLLLVILCVLSGCISQKETKQVLSTENQFIISKSAININTASAKEIEKLPNIGAKTARKIVEHREKFGKFRKPEYLLLVGGISDKRFREMRALIKVE